MCITKRLSDIVINTLDVLCVAVASGGSSVTVFEPVYDVAGASPTQHMHEEAISVVKFSV